MFLVEFEILYILSVRKFKKKLLSLCDLPRGFNAGN